MTQDNPTYVVIPRSVSTDTKVNASIYDVFKQTAQAQGGKTMTDAISEMGTLEQTTVPDGIHGLNASLSFSMPADPTTVYKLKGPLTDDQTENLERTGVQVQKVMPEGYRVMKSFP